MVNSQPERQIEDLASIPFLNWTISDVSVFLSYHPIFAIYTSVFAKQKIDGIALGRIQEDELIQIGMKNDQARLALLFAIEQLKKRTLQQVVYEITGKKPKRKAINSQPKPTIDKTGTIAERNKQSLDPRQSLSSSHSLTVASSTIVTDNDSQVPGCLTLELDEVYNEPEVELVFWSGEEKQEKTKGKSDKSKDDQIIDIVPRIAVTGSLGPNPLPMSRLLPSTHENSALTPSPQVHMRKVTGTDSPPRTAQSQVRLSSRATTTLSTLQLPTGAVGVESQEKDKGLMEKTIFQLTGSGRGLFGNPLREETNQSQKQITAIPFGKGPMQGPIVGGRRPSLTVKNKEALAEQARLDMMVKEMRKDGRLQAGLLQSVHYTKQRASRAGESMKSKRGGRFGALLEEAEAGNDTTAVEAIIDEDIGENQGLMLNENEQEIPKEKTYREKIGVSKWVILPNASWRNKWEVLITLLVLYYAVVTPYTLAWSFDDLVVTVLQYFEVIFSLLFVFDMIINFFSSFKYTSGPDSGSWEYNLNTIAKHYLNSWFWIDLIAAVPIDIILLGMNNESDYLRLLRLLKVFRVLKVNRAFNMFSENLSISIATLRMIKVFLLLLIWWHWVACCYWFILFSEGFDQSDYMGPPARTGEDEQEYSFSIKSNFPSSINHRSSYRVQRFDRINETADSAGDQWSFSPNYYHLPTQPQFIQYLQGFLWATTSTTSTGDNIKPQTDLETIFIGVCCLCGILILSIVLGTAGNFIDGWDNDNRDKRDAMQAIRTSLLQQDVPTAMIRSILAFYEYRWSSFSGSEIGNKEGPLQGLHANLQSELDVVLHRRLVSKVPMFQSVSESCILELGHRLKSVISVPDELVVVCGEPVSSMYFIMRGKLEVLNEQTEIVATLQDGDSFGKKALLLRERINVTIRACTYCELLILSRRDFKTIIYNHADFGANLYKHIYAPDASNYAPWEKIAYCIRLVRMTHLLQVQSPPSFIDMMKEINQIKEEQEMEKDTVEEQLPKIQPNKRRKTLRQHFSSNKVAPEPTSTSLLPGSELHK